MGTAEYIAELLYRYNCIVVPGFGAFLSQTKSATIQESTHTFYPPTKALSFNEQLASNDGLLVSYIASAEKSSFEFVLKRISEQVLEWKTTLEKDERLSFANIGDLWLNTERKIQFQPNNQVNYLTSSFGFSSFVSKPIVREVLKEEVVAVEEKIPFIITPEKRESSSFRPLVKYAAIALLAISTGLTGFRIYTDAQQTNQLVQKEAQEQVSKHIQEATFFNADPSVLPTFTIDITKIEQSKAIHHIVAGAFRVKENAEKKIIQLQNKGYDAAAYIGANKYGLHQVVYASFEDSKKGSVFLKKIQQTESPDAWMLSDK